MREAEEEIGLAPEQVEVVGALPPIGTFVTSYKVHPFVGLIGDELDFEPSPTEVETVLAFSVDRLREGFAMRRLVRRGVPIRTPTYVVDEHLIWGATARILGELLKRLERGSAVARQQAAGDALDARLPVLLRGLVAREDRERETALPALAAASPGSPANPAARTSRP